MAVKTICINCHSIMEDVKDGYVYFIQCGDSGPIKIGYSLGDVERRLTIAQIYNPCLLTLLAVMPGSRKKRKTIT